ncbi:hypothetical protein ACO1O0_007154 [Amphichorda felina]
MGHLDQRNRFEALPVEIHILITDACDPEDALNLLRASPNLRRAMGATKGKERLLAFAYLRSKMPQNWGIGFRTPGSDIIRAMGIVSIRLRCDQYMDHPEDLPQAVAPYIQDIMFATVREEMKTAPFRWKQPRFLLKLFEWGAQVEGFGSRSISFCITRSHPWASMQDETCRCAKTDKAVYCCHLKGTIRRALVRFDSCCHTFFLGDAVMDADLRLWERKHCTEAGRLSGPRAYHVTRINWGWEFWAMAAASRLVFTHHKVLLNSVARGLGLSYSFETVPFALRPEAELPKELIGATVEHDDDSRRVEFRVFVFARRALDMEDGYCRWQTSCGLDLVDRLWNMSHAELRDYTLTKYDEFAAKQRPKADPTVPKPLIWDGKLIGDQLPKELWDKCKDKTRMTYTAWYWDMLCDPSWG